MPEADPFEAALDELLLAIWSRPRDVPGEPPDDLLRRLAELRQVYADWLEEHGDPMAQLQRWLVHERKFPRYTGEAQDTWDWWNYGDRSHCKAEDLPVVIWQRLPGAPQGTPPNYKEYPSRRAAERALFQTLWLLDKLDA